LRTVPQCRVPTPPLVDNLGARLREARADRTRGLALGVEGVHFPKLPWEKDATEAINMATGLLQDIDKATSCDGGQALVVGIGLIRVESGRRREGCRPAASELSARFSAFAAALFVADLAGLC